MCLRGIAHGTYLMTTAASRLFSEHQAESDVTKSGDAAAAAVEAAAIAVNGAKALSPDWCLAR